MSSTKDACESEVTTALESTSLVTIVQLEILGLSIVEALLSRPFEGIGPCLVSKPVADEVGVTSIDQDWDFLENAGDQSVERLHPVTLEKEVSVDIKVAAVITANFNTKLLLNIGSVQEVADPAKSRVAQVAAVFAFATDIINVLSSSLVRSDECVVAVNACWDAGPNALAVIAVLDQALATRKSVIHSLTFALVENGWVSTLSTSHWSVVFVLCESIGQAVTDKDGLQVDVALLVR